MREQQHKLLGDAASLGRNTAATSISYRELSAEAKAELRARARRSNPGTNSGQAQKNRELKKFRSRVEKDVSCSSLATRLTWRPVLMIGLRRERICVRNGDMSYCSWSVRLASRVLRAPQPVVIPRTALPGCGILRRQSDTSTR